MKEKYAALELEVIRFHAEDMMTASGDCVTPTSVEYNEQCDYIA